MNPDLVVIFYVLVQNNSVCDLAYAVLGEGPWLSGGASICMQAVSELIPDISC